MNGRIRSCRSRSDPVPDAVGQPLPAVRPFADCAFRGRRRRAGTAAIDLDSPYFVVRQTRGGQCPPYRTSPRRPCPSEGRVESSPPRVQHRLEQVGRVVPGVSARGGVGLIGHLPARRARPACRRVTIAVRHRVGVFLRDEHARRPRRAVPAPHRRAWRSPACGRPSPPGSAGRTLPSGCRTARRRTCRRSSSISLSAAWWTNSAPVRQRQLLRRGGAPEATDLQLRHAARAARPNASSATSQPLNSRTSSTSTRPSAPPACRAAGRRTVSKSTAFGTSVTSVARTAREQVLHPLRRRDLLHRQPPGGVDPLAVASPAKTSWCWTK